MRWELEDLRGGTRLTLWTHIGHRFMALGAAGWHFCFDVLAHLLSGTPIGCTVGPEAMKFPGWQRLNGEYAKQFGVETLNWPPKGGSKVVNWSGESVHTLSPINGAQINHERSHQAFNFSLDSHCL